MLLKVLLPDLPEINCSEEFNTIDITVGQKVTMKKTYNNLGRQLQKLSQEKKHQ